MAILHLSSTSALSLGFNKLPLSQNVYSSKPFTLKVSASMGASIADKLSTSIKTNDWRWNFKDTSIKIYSEEHEKEKYGATKNILMVPTISDVSTVEEWRSVAKDIVERWEG